jgi:hypothetical protein
MVLFEEPHLKIEFKNIPCRHLVTTWMGMARGKLYKEGILTILKCCRENNIKKVLTDTRRQESISLDDKRYASQTIREHMTKHGLFFQAVVVSSDVFLQFTADNFDRTNFDKSGICQFFSNDKEAINWLIEVDLHKS